MSHEGCIHLLQYKATRINDFRSLYSHVIAASSKKGLKAKVSISKCFNCKCHTWRLHICLYCIFVGCYDGQCIHRHAYSKHHYLAVELDHGHIFCFLCKDYIYDAEIDDIRRRCKFMAARALGIIRSHHSWEPTAEEFDLMSLHPRKLYLKGNNCLGLRGLINQGNTCYVNCIIQVLMHTPLLRNFFFSEQHVCRSSKDEAPHCLACELFTLFKEFYSGKKEPYVPARFFYLILEQHTYLKGKGQMDIQEFLSVVLLKLREHCNGANGTNDSKCNTKGNIINQCFVGKYLQIYTCQNCNMVSRKSEEFYDVPLDIQDHDHHTGNSSAQQESVITCLNRYTALKSLNDENTTCHNCGKTQNSTIQSSFKHLPIVLALQFRRFKVLKDRNDEDVYLKNYAFVSFPELLDMEPFLCSTIYQPDKRDNFTNIASCKYSLFAVVRHDGELNSGHYYTYIKQQKNRWFHCNDSSVEAANISDILNEEAYMLFYHKHILEYE